MKKLNKKKLILPLILLIGIGITVAYFFSSTTFSNKFIAKDTPTIKTVEKFKSPDDWEPGDTTEKTSITTNVDFDGDLCVRLKFDEEWVSANGNKLPLFQGVNRAAIINYDNDSYWKEADDGYYYYQGEINIGESTLSPIKSVTFNPRITNDNECTESTVNGKKRIECKSTGDGYDGATYTLTITTEAMDCELSNEIWNPTYTKYTVTVEGDTHTASSTGTGSFEPFETVDVKVTATSGYKVSTLTAKLSDGTTVANASGDEISFAMARGNVTIYAETSPIDYVIHYNRNSNTYNTAVGISGTAPSDTNASYDESVTLNTNTWYRVGYRFLGWSETASDLTATYADGDTVSNLTTTDGEEVDLYAIWQPQNLLVTISTLQEITPSICTNTYQPTNNTTAANTNQYYSADNIPQATLTDTRDNNTYRVRKTADNRCWIVDNLRIVNKTIYSTDSNITASSFTIPASINVFANSTTPQVYYGDNNATYGALYNYYAATAGTGTGTAGPVDSDICPKGWYLPYGSDFLTSFAAYNAEQGVTGGVTSATKWGSVYIMTNSGYLNCCSYSGRYRGENAAGYNGWWTGLTTGSMIGTSQYQAEFRYNQTPEGLGTWYYSPTMLRVDGISIRCISKES